VAPFATGVARVGGARGARGGADQEVVALIIRQFVVIVVVAIMGIGLVLIVLGVVHEEEAPALDGWAKVDELGGGIELGVALRLR
jgi:hypothetical protein